MGELEIQCVVSGMILIRIGRALICKARSDSFILDTSFVEKPWVQEASLLDA